VTKQQDERNRQIISERQTLIQRTAELEHNNDDKLAGLTDAHASAAQELGRLNGDPEEPAIESARSAIWRTALGQRLAAGDDTQAITLFDRIKDQLALPDRRAIELPIQAAAMNQMADQWIEREAAVPGEPLIVRLQADRDLSPLEKAVVRTKVDARDSVQAATAPPR
jgi:hypothetical protein